MSGVDSRSRLERVDSLRRRTMHEISIARRHANRPRVLQLHDLLNKLEAELKLPKTRLPKPKRRRNAPRQKATDSVTQHLEQLGVTSHDVKVWAVTTGLLDQVRRGRIRGELVAAYEHAHHPTRRTR